ncbi:MAG: hypothetical protein QXO37_06855 [Candidatus Nitrosocaldaceae archaeon]
MITPLVEANDEYIKYIENILSEFCSEMKIPIPDVIITNDMLNPAYVRDNIIHIKSYLPLHLLRIVLYHELQHILNNMQESMYKEHTYDTTILNQ